MEPLCKDLEKTTQVLVNGIQSPLQNRKNLSTDQHFQQLVDVSLDKKEHEALRIEALSELLHHLVATHEEEAAHLIAQNLKAVETLGQAVLETPYFPLQKGFFLLLNQVLYILYQSNNGQMKSKAVRMLGTLPEILLNALQNMNMVVGDDLARNYLNNINACTKISTSVRIKSCIIKPTSSGSSERIQIDEWLDFGQTIATFYPIRDGKCTSVNIPFDAILKWNFHERQDLIVMKMDPAKCPEAMHLLFFVMAKDSCGVICSILQSIFDQRMSSYKKRFCNSDTSSESKRRKTTSDANAQANVKGEPMLEPQPVDNSPSSATESTSEDEIEDIDFSECASAERNPACSGFRFNTEHNVIAENSIKTDNVIETIDEPGKDYSQSSEAKSSGLSKLDLSTNRQIVVSKSAAVSTKIADMIADKTESLKSRNRLTQDKIRDKIHCTVTDLNNGLSLVGSTQIKLTQENRDLTYNLKLSSQTYQESQAEKVNRVKERTGEILKETVRECDTTSRKLLDDFSSTCANEVVNYRWVLSIVALCIIILCIIFCVHEWREVFLFTKTEWQKITQ